MWSFDQSEPKTITEMEISISWSDRWVVPKGFSLGHQRGNQGDANFLPHHSDLITPNLPLASNHSYWPSAKKHPAFSPDWQEAGIAIGSHEKPWVARCRSGKPRRPPLPVQKRWGAAGRGGIPASMAVPAPLHHPPTRARRGPTGPGLFLPPPLAWC